LLGLELKDAGTEVNDASSGPAFLDGESFLKGIGRVRE